MLSSRKSLYILIIILVIVLIGIVFYIYNKPHRNINDEEPIANVMADKLFMEYEQNEVEANKKFLDKAIVIAGKIGELDTSKENELILVFKNTDDFFGISCSFGNEMKQLLANKNVGDSIKIKGICKGYLSDVVLIDCIIIE